MHHLSTIPLVALAIAAFGCDVKVGRFAEDRAVALSATQNLRELYNSEDFDRIYALGAPMLRGQVSREEFAASVAASMKRSGRFVSANLVASSCFVNEVRLVYHSEFEKGKFTESVLWSVPKAKAELVMYVLSPGHTTTDKASQKNCPT